MGASITKTACTSSSCGVGQRQPVAGFALVCRWFVAGLSLTEIAQNAGKIAQNCDFKGLKGLTE